MLIKNISDKTSYPSINIYETKLIKRNSGITLPGIGIFIHQDIKGLQRLRMLQHEYGHFLDYQFNFKKKIPFLSLMKFYVVVGIPSIFNLITGFGGEHRSYFTEKRANKLAERWFGSNLAQGFTQHYPLA